MSRMNIYGVIHYFVEGGQNGNFHQRFRVKLQGGKKMTSERLQHQNLEKINKKLEKCRFPIFEWSPLAHNATKIAKVDRFY